MTDYRQAAARLRELKIWLGHVRPLALDKFNFYEAANFLDHAAADRERLEQIRAWVEAKNSDGRIRECAKNEVRAILGDPHE